MKKLFLILFLLLPLACSAATVTLSWDPMPSDQSWATVRCYEISGTTYTQVGEVVSNINEMILTNVVPGVHKYIVRSFVDTAWGESVDSNMVQTPPLPSAPQHLKFTVTVTISAGTP